MLLLQIAQACTSALTAAHIRRAIQWLEANDSIDFDARGFKSLWEQGAEAHAAGTKLKELAQEGKLQDAAPSRLPAGTSTMRWVESWAQEQKVVRSKSVWQQVREKHAA